MNIRNIIIHHWMPDQTVALTMRKYGLLYRLTSGRVTKGGGVLATYELP